MILIAKAILIFVIVKLKYMFCKKHVLDKLGNEYPDFFLHLGLKYPDIKTAQINNNQDAAGAIRQLWDR